MVCLKRGIIGYKLDIGFGESRHNIMKGSITCIVAK